LAQGSWLPILETSRFTRTSHGWQYTIERTSVPDPPVLHQDASIQPKISILRPPSASDRTPRRAVEPLSQLWRFSDQASRRVVFSDEHPHLRLHHVVRSDGCARRYRPSGILHGPRLSGGIVLPGVWPRDRSSRTRPDPVPAWPVRVEAEQPQYQQVCPKRIDNTLICISNMCDRALARDLKCRIFTLVCLDILQRNRLKADIFQDLRNHGQSFHAPEHNYSVMAEDVQEFIDQQKLDKCVLIGHSM
jgi:hypothetical protein